MGLSKSCMTVVKPQQFFSMNEVSPFKTSLTLRYCQKNAQQSLCALTTKRIMSARDAMHPSPFQLMHDCCRSFVSNEKVPVSTLVLGMNDSGRQQISFTWPLIRSTLYRVDCDALDRQDRQPLLASNAHRSLYTSRH